MHRILLAAMLLLISGTAHAAAPGAPTPPTAQGATRIETDQKTGAVKIIVNGKEVARFDAHGLHVRDGIEYAGKEKDIGSPADYDKTIAAEPKH